MHSYAILALAAAGYASAQGVAAGTLLPKTSTPAGCSQNYPSKFEITIVQAAMMKRDVEKRQSSCSDNNILVASLSNGVLTDNQNRIGGIVANQQFQFDGPPSQTGTLINGGWSVCNNGSLALGGSSIFYQCLSGGFYNLYDTAVAAQCQQVLIDVIPCSGAAASSSVASSSAVVASSSASTKAVVASSSSAAGSAPVSSAATTLRSTSRAATSAVTSSVRATAVPQAANLPAPVNQISDGQIQMTGYAPQISSARPTSTPRAPVSQISDGQIQATSAAPRVNATSTAPARTQFTGAANLNTFGAEIMVGAAAAAAFALL